MIAVMYYLPRLSSDQIARFQGILKSSAWEVAPRFSSVLVQILAAELHRREQPDRETDLPTFETRLWTDSDVGEALKATEMLCTVLQDSELAAFADKLHDFVLVLAIARLTRQNR